VFDAGRRLAASRPLRTEVAEPGGDGNKVHVDFIRTGGNKLVYPDADHAVRKVVFLLAGDLTGMASGAPFVLNQ
jgi:hypothetical protein